MGTFVSKEVFDRYSELREELILIMKQKVDILKEFTEENRGSKQERAELEKLNSRSVELNREIHEIEKEIFE